jgi:hypothetical protein
MEKLTRREKTWKKFKSLFTKAINDNKSDTGTLKAIGIANAVNRIPIIRYFTRFSAYFLLVKNTRYKNIKRIKKMTIFSILKIDDEYTLKQYPSVG